MSSIIECSECEYSERCPCMWSLHNAACLTIQKPKTVGNTASAEYGVPAFEATNCNFLKEKK